MEIEDLLDLDLLIELEGYRCKPYILPPDRFPASGITLGWGVDLGQWSKKEVEAILEKYLPPQRAFALLETIKPFVGKKGQEAAKLVKMAANAISPRDCLELSVAFTHHFLQRIEERIPAFFQLDKKARTAIFTIAWHRGLSVLNRTLGFGAVVRHLVNGNFAAAKKLLLALAQKDERFARRYKKTAEFLA